MKKKKNERKEKKGKGKMEKGKKKSQVGFEPRPTEYRALVRRGEER